MTTTKDVFVEPAPTFSLTGLRTELRRHWDLAEANLTPLDSERDLNVLVNGRAVLKVSNPAEHADVIDMECRALAHVHASDPALPIPATVPARDGEPIVWLLDDSGRECAARLITFLNGTPLEGKVIDVDLAEQVGAIGARLSVALQGFFHPAAGRSIVWDIRQMPAVLAGSALADGPFQPLAERVAPALAATLQLPSGVQHADVTLTNVLAESGAVTAVIDFGDMHHTAAACDLAVTLTSVLRQAGSDDLGDITKFVEAVLRGYQRYRLLAHAEVEILGELVIARLITTLAVSAKRREAHRSNYDYITQYDRTSERILRLLATLPRDELADRIGRLAGTRDLAQLVRPENLPTRRTLAMGGSLSPLFYRSPLHVVRGSGPWLFTKDGSRYLDAYNNVAVIGHTHPAVTNAIRMQLGTLNTHSRYLHAAIVVLAERILATMPAPLDTCLFTTSGTEANELAWRLATEYTGGDAAIIAEHAYHGASKLMADLSSNEWPTGHRPEAVTTYRAPHEPAAQLTDSLAQTRVSAAAALLRDANRIPALVLADSQFTSEGVLDSTQDFSAGLVAGAHAAGALYLADEVQSGYGRSGPQLWRFVLAGVTPDIVTLGKPMGAGYPIGAVITRREIADALAARYEYFSTFAATPVAAAAGHAVLDILQLTDLPVRAVETGMLLRQLLREVAADEPLLGEVRGTGLLAGVDVLATDDAADSRETARSLLDGLVGTGVLAGLTGPGGDVLKVRPPLVWEANHVDMFIDGLVRAARKLRA
jgi:4-aminobutyrate aminotransferase-like enzyme/Ser/Thr protein kinase RdoA (MazF antagonist)